MGFFDKFKANASQPVWRNATGKIACPGDSCPKTCDNTCPIHLNTQAMMLMMSGQGEKAIPLYESAVKIAPDFYDAWNNLAALNGQCGNPNKAYECYLKAHDCDPERSQPLYGLALSSRDMGNYDECIKWCDEYEAIEHDNRTANIRASIEDDDSDDDEFFIFPESTIERRTVAILQRMLESEYTHRIMDYRGGFPNIPEISMPARSICEEILENLQEEIKDLDQLFYTVPAWCAYAGMGAVAMWNEDWPKLRDKGFLASLTEERGYFAMDEFVYDYTGIGWDSEECRSIQNVMKEFASAIIDKGFVKEGKFDMTYYMEALKAMYMYGMVFEMSRLGMH